MRRVTVKHIFQNEISHEFPDVGVFYDDRGVAIVCDPYGLIEIYSATPVDGTDVVLVEENAENLSSDNPEFVIELILSGGAK